VRLGGLVAVLKTWSQNGAVIPKPKSRAQGGPGEVSPRVHDVVGRVDIGHDREVGVPAAEAPQAPQLRVLSSPIRSTEHSRRPADSGSVAHPARSTITAMSECDRAPDLADRLWFTGPHGPYTTEQWEAIRRLLIRSANQWAKALYGCKPKPSQE
jgi:hypothetical protein